MDSVSQPTTEGIGPMIEETSSSDEQRATASLIARLQAKIAAENASGSMRRDAHPKMHGLVRAEFIVGDDVPEDLRIGVFSRPATHKAWIRFSNQDGTVGADMNRDIRGMAIKLLDVPGPRLLEGAEAKTHDFVLISTNAFVTRDVAEFDSLIRALTSGLAAKILFFLFHWRVGWNLYRSMLRFANPLQVRYFSATPYLLATRAVKYSAKPIVESMDSIPASPDPNFLRGAMARQLSRGEARFDFGIQVQADAATMPIEDPGVPWSEDASPFRKVASIVIPMQQFDKPEQDALGEALSFNPWRCLPEHRPLGGINRARRTVYAAISRFRHERNGAPEKEPVGWDV
jgi:hypothetical protein